MFFINFLESHRSIDNMFTHTCLGGGKYFINEKDNDVFLEKYYNDVFIKKNKRSLTEKHNENGIGPILIDLDLKFNLNHFNNFDKIYTTEDMASGEVMFAATGVTDGALLKGIRINNNIATTHSVVMRSKTKTIRYVEASHDITIKPIIS